MSTAIDVEYETHAPCRRAEWGEVHRWVLNSWIRSYRDAGTPGFAFGVDNVTYYAAQHDLIARLLGRCTLHVAVHPGAADLYRGWALTNEGGVVHYVFVKRLYRRAGIARALVERCVGDVPMVYTHQIARYRAEKGLATKLDDAGATYNPYRLFVGRESEDAKTEDG